MDLAEMALHLSVPAIYGEIDPRNYRFISDIKWENHSFSDLDAAIEAKLFEACRGFSNVAVSMSGGIDSTYLIYKIASFFNPNNIHAIFFESHNDQGVIVREQIRRVLCSIDPRIRLSVVNAEDNWWAGVNHIPLQSIPGAALAVERRAISLGCGILITGNGADEILLPPRCMSPEIMRAKQIGKLMRFQIENIGAGFAIVLEEILVPFALSGSSREKKFHYILDEIHLKSSDAWIGSSHRELVQSWVKKYMQDCKRFSLLECSSLAEFDAYLSAMPICRQRGVSDLPIFHPWQEEMIVRIGLGISLTERIGDFGFPLDKRRKRFYLTRLPKRIMGMMPDAKITIKNYFNRGIENTFDNLVRVGLVDPIINSVFLDVHCGMVLTKLDRMVKMHYPIN